MLGNLCCPTGPCREALRPILEELGAGSLDSKGGEDVRKASEAALGGLTRADEAILTSGLDKGDAETNPVLGLVLVERSLMRAKLDRSPACDVEEVELRVSCSENRGELLLGPACVDDSEPAFVLFVASGG